MLIILASPVTLVSPCLAQAPGPSPATRQPAPAGRAALEIPSAAPRPGEARRADPAPGDSIDQALQLLREVFEGIHEAYVEPVSVEALLDAALAGLHERLDPHTKVLSAEEFQAVRSRQGTSVGVGISLAADGARARVRAVHPGSPAERAGLEPGDLLLAVDGTPVRAADLEAAAELLRGSLGSTVRLSVAAPGHAARDVTLQRETVSRDALAARRLGADRVGYLQIHRFARGTADRVEVTVGDWVLQEVEGLIIDLRENPGGFIDEAARTADLLLPVGADIVRTVGRLPEENSTLVSRRAPIAAHLPVVLLVDSLTASSAEVFAGALMGHPRVMVLGEPTYGKRTVQRLVPLSNGGALKVTASLYCTPSDPEFAASGAGAGRAACAAGAGAASEEQARVGNLHTRGRRLEPDRRLDSPDPADPAARLIALGLLQRFEAESTLTAQDRAEQSFWSGPRPPAAGGARSGDWTRACQEARGFDRWCARLRSRLREWGWGDELPATPALRRAWFADWVAERWGPEAGDLAAAELDPWIVAAVESLEALRPEAPASARAAATLTIP